MKEISMSILEEFNESYIEAFPESFNKKYIPIECLHHGNEIKMNQTTHKILCETQA